MYLCTEYAYQRTMRKNLLPIVVLVILTSCHKQTFEERVAEEINNFNRKESPKRMDEVTTLDSLCFDGTSRTMTYCYSLNGLADDETLLTPEVKGKQREALLLNLRGNIQLKPHKEQGFNFEYCYYSHKSGKLLLRERFTQEDYK